MRVQNYETGSNPSQRLSMLAFLAALCVAPTAQCRGATCRRS